MSVATKLAELGIEIPVASRPLAAYVPAVKVGQFVYTSGQLPMAGGELAAVGKVGGDVTVEQGYEAARLCAINCLAAVNTVSDMEKIIQVVKVTGFVNSAPGFTGQPQVMNGASELLVQVLGECGAHARSAVGMAELPRNAAVEVEMIFLMSE
ncbi:MAG: RidA family protein [Symbiobacteriaceae bacterium]|nr:RidA family protein [Symbiobacteriaceae bacterium]